MLPYIDIRAAFWYPQYLIVPIRVANIVTPNNFLALAIIPAANSALVQRFIRIQSIIAASLLTRSVYANIVRIQAAFSAVNDFLGEQIVAIGPTYSAVKLADFLNSCKMEKYVVGSF